jgi:hypothetical protein
MDSRYRNRRRQYPYPLQDAAASVAATELIPVELDIKSLYEGYDHRRRECGNEKAVSPHVQVCNGCTPIHNKADEITSVDALKIEPHSRRFAKGERSR